MYEDYDDKPKREPGGRRLTMLVLQIMILIVAGVVFLRFVMEDDTAVEQPPAPTQINDKVSADTLKDQAQAAAEVNDLRQAISQYTAALELDPTDAEAYYQRGSLYYKQADYDKAIADFSNAIEHGYVPLSYPYYDRARANYEVGDYKATVRDYTRSLELDPDCENQCYLDYYNRGRAQHQLGEYKAAIGDYTRALERNYEPATFAYYYRGMANFELEEYEAAIKDFNHSIDADPDCEYNCQFDYNDRAVAYSRLDDHQAAVDGYTRAIQVDPEYALAYNNRGFAYDKLDKYTQALADWDMALRLRESQTLPRRMTLEDEAFNGTISGKGVQVVVSFPGTAGDVITIAAKTPDSSLDPLLMLRAPDDAPIAFNDDANEDTADAEIEAFELPEDGTYTIIIAGVGGTSTGTFELTLTVE